MALKNGKLSYIVNDLQKTGDKTPIGTIMPYTGSSTNIPSGWLLCDGSTLSRSTYAALYAVILNSFGYGNGSTTFHLPDLRGRFARGAGQASGDRTASNAGGNSDQNQGSLQSTRAGSHDHGAANTQNGSLFTLAVAAGSSNNVYAQAGGGSNFGGNFSKGAASGTTNGNFSVGAPVLGATSNHNGTGSVAKPVNVNVNYIIKF